MIVQKVQTPSKQIKVARKVLDKYFGRDITPKDRDDVIDKALEEWFKRHPQGKTIHADKDINERQGLVSQ